MTYIDQVVVTRNAVSGRGKSVVAYGSGTGVLDGFLQESEHTVPAVPHDAASVRTLRDSMTTNLTRRALTAAEMRNVADVIAFVRQRCPHDA